MLVCTKCGMMFGSIDMIDIKMFARLMQHPVCPLYNCTGFIKDIDDALVDVLRKFWKLRISTLWSCSGHLHTPGDPYVVFGAFSNRQETSRVDHEFDSPSKRNLHTLNRIAREHIEGKEGSYTLIKIDAMTRGSYTWSHKWSAKDVTKFGVHMMIPSSLSVEKKIDLQASFLKYLYEIAKIAEIAFNGENLDEEPA